MASCLSWSHQLHFFQLTYLSFYPSALSTLICTSVQVLYISISRLLAAGGKSPWPHRVMPTHICKALLVVEYYLFLIILLFVFRHLFFNVMGALPLFNQCLSGFSFKAYFYPPLSATCASYFTEKREFLSQKSYPLPSHALSHICICYLTFYLSLQGSLMLAPVQNIIPLLCFKCHLFQHLAW